MRAPSLIDAGTCGFRTAVVADRSDTRHVTFAVETECDEIARLAAALEERQPIDVDGEVDKRNESVILATAPGDDGRVPQELRRAAWDLQGHAVVAELALPKDVPSRSLWTRTTQTREHTGRPHLPLPHSFNPGGN